MKLWFLLDEKTRQALMAAFKGLKPPPLGEDGRDIIFTPIIRIEDVEKEMVKTPHGGPKIK